MKPCSRCRVEKSLDNFHRDRLKRDCNCGVGLLEEDPERLERAARYLRERIVRLEVIS